MPPLDMDYVKVKKDEARALPLGRIPKGKRQFLKSVLLSMKQLLGLVHGARTSIHLDHMESAYMLLYRALRGGMAVPVIERLDARLNEIYCAAACITLILKTFICYHRRLHFPKTRKWLLREDKESNYRRVLYVISEKAVLESVQFNLHSNITIWEVLHLTGLATSDNESQLKAVVKKLYEHVEELPLVLESIMQFPVEFAFACYYFALGQEAVPLGIAKELGISGSSLELHDATMYVEIAIKKVGHKQALVQVLEPPVEAEVEQEVAKAIKSFV